MLTITPGPRVDTSINPCVVPCCSSRAWQCGVVILHVLDPSNRCQIVGKSLTLTTLCPSCQSLFISVALSCASSLRLLYTSYVLILSNCTFASPIAHSRINCTRTTSSHNLIIHNVDSVQIHRSSSAQCSRATMPTPAHDRSGNVLITALCQWLKDGS